MISGTSAGIGGLIGMEILATSKDGQNRAAADPWMVVHLSSGLATEGPESLANAAGDVAVFSFWAGRG